MHAFTGRAPEHLTEVVGTETGYARKFRKGKVLNMNKKLSERRINEP
jgi:hypothetical protein